MNDLKETTVENPSQGLPKKKPVKQKPETRVAKVFRFIGKHRAVFYIIAALTLVSACTYLVIDSITVGARSAAGNYMAVYQEEKDLAYQSFYQYAFDRAEKRYHVSNRVLISIGSLEEVERLEVLKANAIEFVTENREDNDGNITSWLEVEGEGTFVVDLLAAEFIVDNDRQLVLVRVPSPELTGVKIITISRRLFKDDWRNGSFQEGVHLANRQEIEAKLKIEKSLMANQYTFKCAQDVAKSMIVNLVKALNPGVSDLIVEVECMR